MLNWTDTELNRAEAGPCELKCNKFREPVYPGTQVYECQFTDINGKPL